MTIFERAVLDTNVLVHAHCRDDPNHVACLDLLQQAQKPGAALCVSPQVLAEFYAVMTNRKRVSHPFTAQEAVEEIRTLLSLPGLTVLPVPLDVVDCWLDLASSQSFTGQRIFDIQLVATMIGNGVKALYTFNHKDFEPFESIEVRTPV